MSVNVTERLPSPEADRRPWGLRRFPLVWSLGLLTLVLLALVHIGVGTLELSPRQVVLALVGQAESALHHTVVWEIRLPRALVALVAGGLLGLAGAVLQTLTRNPLAEPGLLGISSGAVLAIVLTMVLMGNGTLPTFGGNHLILPLVGALGGFMAGVMVYSLSYQRGSLAGVDPMRLVLVGVLVAGINGSLIAATLLVAQEEQVLRIVQWTVGSTSGRVWPHWHTIWPVALVAVPLTMVVIGLAGVLMLGDGLATGLGASVARARIALFALTALLTAGAVSVVGAVGFVGLVGPHAARLVAWNLPRRLFPLAMLFSAILLLTSDIVARTLTLDGLTALTGLSIPAGAQVPVGAITALLGAPFFLFLLLRGRVNL
ncbi:MAG: FecCD family ABC transporter permease [Marinobacter sp.]